MKHDLTRRWHVVQTYAGAEWQVHNTLLRRGARSYFPYLLADRRQGRWSQGVIRPQFPGYLFACSEMGKSVQPILDTVGVRGLLRSGIDIIGLPQTQIDRIRAQCQARFREGLPRRIDQRPLKIGDIVAVPYGPFVGAPVEIRSIDRGRVLASMGGLTVSFQVQQLAA